MKNKIVEDLKILKRVEPDKNFIESTRHLILATKPQSSFYPLPSWVAFPISVIAVIILVGTVIGFLTPFQKPTVSSFDIQELRQEFNNLDATIQIKEITYRQDINATIADALNEISSSRASHLNFSVIELENNYINQLEKPQESQIDELLNKVIF